MAVNSLAVARPVTSGATFARSLVVVTVIPWVAVIGAILGGVDLSAGLAVVFVVAIGPGHVGSTAAFYLDRDAWPILRANPGRYFVAPVVATVVAVAVMIAAPAGARPVVFAGLAVWQIHHITKQTYGVLAFWCRATNRQRLTDDERRLVLMTEAIGVLGAASLGDIVDLPFELAGLIAVTVCAVAWWRVVGDDLARSAALFGAVVFYLPLYFLGANPYIAALAYLWAHGAQYQLMMSRVARPGPSRVGVLLAIVVVAWLIVHSTNLGVDVAPVLLGLAVGASISHYVIDAGMWRLSEPMQRAYMRDRFDFL